jgi:hypothetical protein
MRRCNRRDFAMSLALAGLFAPFVRLVTPTQAQVVPGQAKYLFIFYTNGTDPAVWSPKGSTTSSLVHSEMTQPLSSLDSDIIIVEKLDSQGTAGSHGAPGGLCGANFSGTPLISVDQYLSDQLQSSGVQTQIPNLMLGGVSSEAPSTFYRNNQVLSPIYSPSTAYSAIFGAGVPDLPSDSSESAALLHLRRRQSMLDVLTGEISQLSQTLGAEERAKLEAHADSLRQMEQRLAQQEEQLENPDPVQCSTPSNPGSGSEPLLDAAMHMDLAINAFACDLTRVATVEFGHHQNTQVSLSEVGAPGDWHNTFMHSDNPRTRLVNLERWLAGQFVAAANKLKATSAPDGDGSLFDQTLMVWARGMGDAIVHDGTDMRFVLSGGAGGYLRPGGSYINGGGQAHSKVLASMLEAMGVSDFSGLGSSSTDKVPLSELRA